MDLKINLFIYSKYGYIILFAWGMLEGEAGLIMAGLLSHSGDMNLYLTNFIAGLGGFAGDQVYFYVEDLIKVMYIKNSNLKEGNLHLHIFSFKVSF